jgi:hypothetical protein
VTGAADGIPHHTDPAGPGVAGAAFRNQDVDGPGGKQILLQDPCGDIIEFFEPTGVVKPAR